MSVLGLDKVLGGTLSAVDNLQQSVLGFGMALTTGVLSSVSDALSGLLGGQNGAGGSEGGPSLQDIQKQLGEIEDQLKKLTGDDAPQGMPKDLQKKIADLEKQIAELKEEVCKLAEGQEQGGSEAAGGKGCEGPGGGKEDILKRLHALDQDLHDLIGSISGGGGSQQSLAA